MKRENASGRDSAERASGLSLRATRRGEVLGNTYRLLEIVGSGGMAEVYAAEHLRLGRKFAVKLLRPGTRGQSLQRFRREVQAVARLENEFVVGVIDCGEASDGTPYLVMELLRGEDLRSLVEREGALPIPRAVNFVWEACQGIAAVHALSLVHRDLKPENLFVSKRATGQDWCRVLDFGIAKSDVSSSTTEGAVMGTVRYMAPEQLHDAATAGPTADVYALGAVLYECLSGASPHDGGSVQELMFRILNEEPTRLDRRRPGVPKELADAVQRALAKLPAQRFADVQGFAKAIAPYARAAHTAELDSRCATVDLEQEGRGASSAPRERFGRYSAIVLSGIVGLGVGAALNFPRVARPPKPRIAESAPSAQPRASVVSSSASVPTAASLPPAPFVASAPSASAPTGGSSPAKARPSSGTRPRVVQAQVRFDSENPYGK